MKLTSIPRIKRISLSVTKPRRRAIASRVFRNLMSGGPCRSLYLSCPGTLCFSVGEFRGYYNAKNEWCEL